MDKNFTREHSLLLSWWCLVDLLLPPGEISYTTVVPNLLKTLRTSKSIFNWHQVFKYRSRGEKSEAYVKTDRTSKRTCKACYFQHDGVINVRKMDKRKSGTRAARKKGKCESCDSVERPRETDSVRCGWYGGDGLQILITQHHHPRKTK